jgi:hypothetical protein
MEFVYSLITQIVGQHFYIKRRWRGREQDSRETERERERERERGSVWGKGEIASVIK